ncbi:hypothetical protein ACJBYG_11710, partial [Streptococcus suis]
MLTRTSITLDSPSVVTVTGIVILRSSSSLPQSSTFGVTTRLPLPSTDTPLTGAEGVITVLVYSGLTTCVPS